MLIKKLISNNREYEAALARMHDLMGSPAGSDEGDELELLAVIIEKYEEKQFPIDLPSPAAAIKFRMEQEGLRPADLVQYLGNKSRVSEILNGKRDLSLKMIRAVHRHLGIPAEVLLQKKGDDIPAMPESLDPEKFPLSEMIQRGWFAGANEVWCREWRKFGEELLGWFWSRLGGQAELLSFNRQGLRMGGSYDDMALLAWKAQVRILAAERKSIVPFSLEAIDAQFLNTLARFSALDQGPNMVQEYLANVGIHFVTVRHLKKTHLDGAAMKDDQGHPIIAMTLRHDRLDNFWFTLFHELGHVALHLDGEPDDQFVDDLDTDGDRDPTESQADVFALDHLIPPDAWRTFIQAGEKTAGEVLAFARKLGISPAIVAGRYRAEKKAYRLFTPMIANGAVRNRFFQD